MERCILGSSRYGAWIDVEKNGSNIEYDLIFFGKGYKARE